MTSCVNDEEEDLRKINACKYNISKRESFHALNERWKGEMLLLLLKRIPRSSQDVHYTEDPIAPTLGALHHVRKMCDSATCLYCNQNLE